jgi:carboxymethylenebutenolidase
MTTSVRDSWVSIPVAGGQMSGLLAEPSAPANGGIVLLQEIFGVNAAMRDAAHFFAGEGYSVLAPDLFWLLERRVDLGYSDADRQRGFGLMQAYDQTAGTSDIAAAIGWLRAHLSAKAVALVGFCLGGRMAVLAGAGNPDVTAIVSFYGVRLDSCAEKLRALAVPFQLHVGDRDAHVPHEHIDAVRSAVAGKPGAEVFVYEGAQHGFCNRLRKEVFAEEAAALASSRALRLLRPVTA